MTKLHVIVTKYVNLTREEVRLERGIAKADEEEYVVI
jgi:hypothetical protein